MRLGVPIRSIISENQKQNRSETETPSTMAHALRRSRLSRWRDEEDEEDDEDDEDDEDSQKTDSNLISKLENKVVKRLFPKLLSFIVFM